jgi:hypothetical protein
VSVLKTGLGDVGSPLPNGNKLVGFNIHLFADLLWEEAQYETAAQVNVLFRHSLLVE